MGDKAIFFAQIADGVEVTGGVFQNAAYCMDMLACWGGAFAIYRSAKPEKKKMTAGILLSGCITSLLTGITEPWLFTFLFTAPMCFIFYSIINGLCYLVCYVLGIRLVATFATGIIDYILVGILNNAPGWYLVIPVGIVFAILEFVIFSFIIKKFHYEDIVAVGGQNDGEPTSILSSKSKYQQALGIVSALGGKDNIETITCCATRLRVVVNDESIVKKGEFVNCGTKGLVDKGKSLQIIIGVDVYAVLNNINAIMSGEEIEIK